jgi:hypothetical protein
MQNESELSILQALCKQLLGCHCLVVEICTSDKLQHQRVSKRITEQHQPGELLPCRLLLLLLFLQQPAE